LEACSTQDPHCITCGDEGIPMTVASADGDVAACDDADGARHEVIVDLVAPVKPGDALLVHAGVAIARLGDDRPAAAPAARPGVAP
jgi:hydrogenase assembly chaperone HypC/HupF